MSSELQKLLSTLIDDPVKRAIARASAKGLLSGMVKTFGSVTVDFGDFNSCERTFSTLRRNLTPSTLYKSTDNGATWKIQEECNGIGTRS